MEIAKRTGDRPVEVTGRFPQAVTVLQLGDVERASSEMGATATLAQQVMNDPNCGRTKVNLPGILG